MPWESIFQFLKVPDAQKKNKIASYICFKVEAPNLVSAENVYLENIIITVYVMSHINHVRGNFRGTRYDNLADEVKKVLLGLEGSWIGELECISNLEDILEKEYPCRILIFKTKDVSGALYED